MKALNFGSLNLDHVYSVPHQVRTGETLPAAGYETHVGGKGLNQSVALRGGGVPVFHAGCVGKDGGMLVDFLASRGVDTSLIRVSDTPTGHAVIQVDAAGDNGILLYPGANYAIDETQAEETLRGFDAGDLLVLQNETSCLETMIRKARDKRMLIALNPSPVDQALLSLPLEMVDILIFNEVEGKQLAGCDAPGDILDALVQKYPRARLVLTLGSAGSVYRQGQIVLRQQAYRVAAVDTTGAGDTFTGFFLSALMRGEQAGDALRLASAAAAMSVTRKGAAESIPQLPDVLDWLTARHKDA
ncbi:MAG: ribokinase [Clostridia bacterium]|nr:ribokinase [Clostridia bacterium]